jgi:hypothetical protein
MESKLNYSAIETYAKVYSSKLCDELFDTSGTITGDDILKLPIKQVGLLIINNIYQSWALEAEKLKSPYFNYQSEAVQSSLQKMMNVLSNNILVDRSSFEPLLIDAVYDCLLLLVSPYSYYKKLLEKEETSIEVLRAMQKFIIINGGVLNKLLDKESDYFDKMKDADKLLGEIFSSMDDFPQNNDQQLQKFSELQPLTESDFYLVTEEVVIGNRELGYDEEEDEIKTEATINDRFVDSAYETVADNLKSNQQVSTIKSMLSINQKFMFINDLFNDNQEDFNKVLDFLESCETKEAATSFIHNNYLKHNIWNANAPHVKEFLALIDKKFSV